MRFTYRSSRDSVKPTKRVAERENLNFGKTVLLLHKVRINFFIIIIHNCNLLYLIYMN